MTLRYFSFYQNITSYGMSIKNTYSLRTYQQMGGEGAGGSRLSATKVFFSNENDEDCLMRIVLKRKCILEGFRVIWILFSKRQKIKSKQNCFRCPLFRFLLYGGVRNLRICNSFYFLLMRSLNL